MVTVTPGKELVILECPIYGLASTSRCSAPTPTASRRSTWRRSSAAASSATSGSRQAPGGELANAFDAGLAKREDVIQLGDVLTGASEGRRAEDEITLFDSTGLAIQDLALCRTVYERWKAGEVDAPVVTL